MYAAAFWTPSRSTLDWIAAAVADLGAPVAQCCRRRVLESGVVGCDDTYCRLVVPARLPALHASNPRSVRTYEVLKAAQEQRKPSVQARVWIYRSFVLSLVAYDFTVSRHRESPAEVLGDYTGYLMGDCWSGFDGIVLQSSERIMLCACCAACPVARVLVDRVRSGARRAADVVDPEAV